MATVYELAESNAVLQFRLMKEEVNCDYNIELAEECIYPTGN